MPNLFEYSYRVIPLNLAAGLTNFELVTDAEKIVYASPTDGPEITVKLQLKANDGIPLRPQGELVAPFQRLYITAAAVAKTVYLLLGSPKDIQLTGRDVSISGSIVTVSAVHNALKNSQLFGGSLSVNPGVGNIGTIQLFNPAGSGKNVTITKALISTSGASGAYNVRRWNAALTNAYQFGVNKSVYGSNSLSLIRYVVQAAEIGSTTDEFMSFPTQANVLVPFEPMLLLNPGEGANFYPVTLNIQNNVSLEFIEENQ